VSARLISIVGPVAVGKTTLARRLIEELDGEIILEDYAGNPFLEKGCDQGSEYGLPSQLYFLFSRVGQLDESTWPEQGLMIADYGFCQDRLYAEAMLGEEDLKLYDRISRRLAGLVHEPEIMIHLDSTIQELRRRIDRRGRTFESRIHDDVIRALRDSHFRITVPDGCSLLRVDSEQVGPDNTAGYRELVDQIRSKL
jgi:deoxyadenosine/deoxycytidine kinase